MDRIPVSQVNQYQDNKTKSPQKRKISSGIKNKIHKLRQAIEEQKRLRRKKKTCDKHLKNLQQKEEEMFITVNDIYESWDSDYKEQLKDESEYNDIDESNIYDDPVSKTIIQIFQDEEKVKVKKIVGVLENEYESIETQYNKAIDDIADFVDTNDYEDMDENLYDYIDLTKLDQIKKANKERKQIETKKTTVKTVIQNLDTMDQDKMVPLEDIYAVPEKLKKKKENVELTVEKPKYTMDDQEYSIYVKQIIDEKFGDEKQGKVKDLICVFEGKMENLKKTQDKVINEMTDMVEKETTKLEEEMVENEIYEKFNHEHEKNSQMNGKDGKVQELIKMYNKQNTIMKPDHNRVVNEISEDGVRLGNGGKRNDKKAKQQRYTN